MGIYSTVRPKNNPNSGQEFRQRADNSTHNSGSESRSKTWEDSVMAKRFNVLVWGCIWIIQTFFLTPISSAVFPLGPKQDWSALTVCQEIQQVANYSSTFRSVGHFLCDRTSATATICDQSVRRSCNILTGKSILNTIQSIVHPHVLHGAKCKQKTNQDRRWLC